MNFNERELSIITTALMSTRPEIKDQVINSEGREKYHSEELLKEYNSLINKLINNTK